MSNFDKLMFQDSCRMHSHSSESDRTVDKNRQRFNPSFGNFISKKVALFLRTAKSGYMLAGVFAFCTLLMSVSTYAQTCATRFTTPPSPVVISGQPYISTFSNVSLNGGTNVASVNPNSTVTITFNQVMNFSGAYCPGCVTYHQIGLGGTQTAISCLRGVYQGTSSASVNTSFTAPATPGVYYISMVNTLDYQCNTVNYDNSAVYAIAVVVVKDITDPTISCPSNVAVNTVANTCSAPASFSAPTVTDNCGVAPAPPISGFTLLGTIGHHAYYSSNAPMLWTAAKADAEARGGHLATISNAAENALLTTGVWSWMGFNDRITTNVYQWVTSEPVTYTNWAPGEPNNPAGEHNGMLFPDGTWNNSNDAISLPYLLEVENIITVAQTAGLASGSTFFNGTTTNVFTATDPSGNTASCSFTVTVTDNQNPVIACPASLSVSATTGNCSRITTFSNPTASDNCSAFPPTSGFTPLGTIGTHSYYLSNAPMLWSAAKADAEARGGHLATISNATENALMATAGVAWMGLNDLAAVGNFKWVTGEPVTYTNWQSGEPNNIGTERYGLMWTAGKWNNGDNATGFRYILEIEGTLTLSQTAGLASGASFPVGTTTNVFTATDAAGNPSSCSFNVVVTDNQAPVITTNGNQSVNNDVGLCGALVTVSATAADNCSVGTPTGVRSDNLALTALYPVGTTTITWNVTDVNGVAAVAVIQTVVVTDNQAPVIATNGNQSVNNDVGLCGALVTVSATAADNCSVGTPTGVRSDNLALTALYPVGTTTITWNVTDVNGVAALAVIQTVVVTDNQAPVIATNGNKSVNNDVGLCGALVTVSATAADNCSVGTPTGVRSDNLALTALYPVGTTTITWNVTDVNGVAALAVIQTVVVTDNQAPVIATNGNQSVNNDVGLCGALVTVSATATDNCSVGTPTGVRSDNLALTALYPVGTTTITWNVTDVNGVAALAVIQTVVVTDNEKPIITCPASANRNTNAGLCTYATVVTEFNATATDNCGVTGLSYVLTGATTGTGTSLAGVKLYVGTTTVTWTAVDAAGNTKTCSFTVVVQDDQNATAYMIYAEKEAKFGEYNYIGGDVGVSATNGKAHFKKYDVLDPFQVKAAEIKYDLPSSINNRTYTPATGGPNPPFYPYSSSTTGLSNIDVTINGTILNGNYKDVKVKKGITATINGNNFDKITIEEGANVTFTATVINVEELTVDKGKKDESLTVVNFSNPASVIVKNKVYVKDDAHVNVGGPKVTFYVGDNYGGDESFKVNGDNTRVTANIMIPNGKLKVEGGGYANRPTIMTGWYIIEKLEANGKHTYWNKYDCSMPMPYSPLSTEKVIADINARAEYERNVIGFVTNQGLKTDYWTAEKLNNTTGSFENLAIQNNVKSKEAVQYLTFYDHSPSEGDNFYRIKQTFAQGEDVYSAVVKLNNPKTVNFTLYPNPADEEAWIDLKSFEGRQITLELSDMLGKTVQQHKIEQATAAPYRLDVADLPMGLYLIKVQAQGKRVFTRKLQVAK